MRYISLKTAAQRDSYSLYPSAATYISHIGTLLTGDVCDHAHGVVAQPVDRLQSSRCTCASRRYACIVCYLMPARSACAGNVQNLTQSASLLVPRSAFSKFRISLRPSCAVASLLHCPPAPLRAFLRNRAPSSYSRL